MKLNVKIRNLGLRKIEMISNSMKDFTVMRNKYTLDEIWLVQHYPVFTYGVSEKEYNWFIPKRIPIIFINRGGKTTYHGPGQIVTYFLLDLIRRNINIKTLMLLMQNVVMSTLKCFSIHSYILEQFPGIYVNDKKICSFGLRIKKGCSLYGMSLNIDMDLSPFSYINPCGNNIKMTQIVDVKPNLNFRTVQLALMNNIKKYFL
ncbi:lipoyl(octanoyl) transferase LipB [Buchnera aphidicola]|uniref:lipoyl(octanoyl) transferase LipB n=1 Tax=Buchnera aphidicola TaxID=9 RepID=UPI0021C585D2|nr:lipoyl(octanoyl) transferase LipB [Buchnera aphidicola]